MRQTSICANKRAEATGLKQAHQLKILRVLEKRKRGTSHHIAMWTGLEYHQIARRMKELVTKMQVYDCGKIGFSPAGLPATTWEYVPDFKTHKCAS